MGFMQHKRRKILYHSLALNDNATLFFDGFPTIYCECIYAYLEMKGIF